LKTKPVLNRFQDRGKEELRWKDLLKLNGKDIKMLNKIIVSRVNGEGVNHFFIELIVFQIKNASHSDIC